MRLRGTVLVFAAALVVTGCGTNRADRIASGAGVGAASGAVIGALVGGISVVPGALIGAGVGAAGGGLTDERDFNLGRPVWR